MTPVTFYTIVKRWRMNSTFKWIFSIFALVCLLTFSIWGFSNNNISATRGPWKNQPQQVVIQKEVAESRDREGLATAAYSQTKKQPAAFAAPDPKTIGQPYKRIASTFFWGSLLVGIIYLLLRLPKFE